PLVFKKLVEGFDDPTDVFRHSVEDLVQNHGVPAEIAQAMHAEESNREDLADTLAVFDSTEIEVLFHHLHAAHFPRLSSGPDWHFLNLLGDTNAIDAPKIIGIVGRRDASDQGLQYAHDLAETLGDQGIPTLSGLARGIDQAAHQGSLSTGGPTLALIPEGILRFLRRSKPHYPILHNGARSPLLILSGCSPWERWSVGEAMRRNRWIAGWCDALIVVEANPEGGTWRTAEAASRLGRPLWVCTGFDQADGKGNRQLIQSIGGQELKVTMEPEEAVALILAEG
ncbi:MAG: DNA-processing protein DprA, partial [Candidatus Omnitrophica bacterium]|nr:DNA-processing protein DprA [Candidatus Omnitrophota bacterium]